MRLMMVAPEQLPLPPIASGSVETCMYEIARNMRPGVNVTILSRQHQGYPKVTKKGRLTIIRLPASSKKRYLQAVTKHLSKHASDWIQIDNRPAFAPIVRRFVGNTKISVFLHSLTFVSPPQTTRSKALKDLATADLIIANSRSLQQQLKRMFPSLSRKIKYTHLGVNTEQFRPPSQKERRKAKKEFRVQRKQAVVFAGRIIPQKGAHVIIRAAHLLRKSMPRLQVVIAGGGKKKAYVQQLHRIAIRSRAPVRFVGKIQRNRMHRLYWSADCFVCPSQKHEAFGLVVVEAMASNVPVIASNIGGISEIIRHQQNGILIRNYRSPQKWAKAIKQTLTDSHRANVLAKQAKITVHKQFRWSRTANSLIHLYRKNTNKP